MRVTLLDEEPAQFDDIGTLAPVADSVLFYLRSMPAPRILALEGSWGSGKSTTVNLIKNALHEGESCYVFDAWGHVEDPLRKRFLEGLLLHLRDAKWLDLPTFEQFQLQIRNRVRDVTTSYRSSPGLMAVGLGVSLLLLPIGQYLLRGDLGLEQSPWLLYAAVFCLVAPILLLGATFTYLLGASLVCKIRKKTLPDFSLVSPLNSKTDTESKLRSIESPETSTLEYVELYERTLRAGLRAGRRLVIVIDNLDRLSPSDAKAAWNVIRTFALTNLTLDKAICAPTYIVPLDRATAGKMWSTEGNPQATSDFWLKEFSLTLRIPPVITSNWRTYFLRQLTKSIGDISENDAMDILRIYEAECGDLRFRTPRSIKAYINSLGALWLQWHDSIPITHVAFWVAKVKACNDQPTEQIITDSPPGNLADSFDDKLRRHLAALFYGVPVDRALELFVASELEKCLADEQLNIDQEVANTSGFWHVLEQSLDPHISEWKKGDHKLGNILLLVAKLRKEDQLAQAVWQRLVTLCSANRLWYPWRRQEELLSLLLSEISSDVVRRRLVESVVSSLLLQPDGDAVTRIASVRSQAELIDKSWKMFGSAIEEVTLTSADGPAACFLLSGLVEAAFPPDRISRLLAPKTFLVAASHMEHLLKQNEGGIGHMRGAPLLKLAVDDEVLTSLAKAAIPWLTSREPNGRSHSGLYLQMSVLRDATTLSHRLGNQYSSDLHDHLFEAAFNTRHASLLALCLLSAACLEFHQAKDNAAVRAIVKHVLVDEDEFPREVRSFIQLYLATFEVEGLAQALGRWLDFGGYADQGTRRLGYHDEDERMVGVDQYVDPLSLRPSQDD